MKSQIVPIAIASVLASAAPAQSQGVPLTGVWLTEDASSKVLFEPCDKSLCGRIVWLRDENDPDTGYPWRDKYNPDQALKVRPLLGLTILQDLNAAGTNSYKGSIYNPEDGRTYTGTVTLQGADHLVLKGCALAGLFCQSETWTRAQP